MSVRCAVSSCKYNDKAYPEYGFCNVEYPEIDRVGKCKTSEIDMEYLRGKWVYQKGKEMVRSNKSDVTAEMAKLVEDEK